MFGNFTPGEGLFGQPDAPRIVQISFAINGDSEASVELTDKPQQLIELAPGGASGIWVAWVRGLKKQKPAQPLVVARPLPPTPPPSGKLRFRVRGDSSAAVKLEGHWELTDDEFAIALLSAFD